ncbi:MAG: hypothetical protein ACI4EE_14185 [Lachnospiraceae bacterium]
MRLIHCKKCGAAMVTENGLIERMNDTVHELNEKARHSKNAQVAASYLHEAASVTKMMKGIMHNTAQIEDRKVTCHMELSEIVNYIRANGLVTDEKIDELRGIARKKAAERNEENQKEIDRIYGEYKSAYTPANKTKSDPTASKAIADASRKKGQPDGKK